MKIPRMGRTCLHGSQIMLTLDIPQPLVTWTVSETIIICSYAHTVSQHIQMLAINSQMYATSVTFMCTAINIFRCFGYPREHNFVLILSPTGCTEGCIYFSQSCRNTHLPNFLDCTQYHIHPLLTCFLPLHTSRTSQRLIQHSTKFGNRHTAHGRYEYSYNRANSRENWPKKIATHSGSHVHPSDVSAPAAKSTRPYVSAAAAKLTRPDVLAAAKSTHLDNSAPAAVIPTNLTYMLHLHASVTNVLAFYMLM